MTNEQAKSELMQIYMSLSEEKKQALDVLMAQADEKKVFKMRDATPEEQEAIDRYIKSISKPTGVDFWDLADGEYISRTKALEDVTETLCRGLPCEECPFDDGDICKVEEWLKKLPTVAIPPDHDGCKDCKHELKSDGEYPCSYCKQNYKDMWEAKANKVGHWEVMYEPKNMVVCSKCGKCAYLYNNRGSSYCPHCGDYKGGELNG